MKVEEEIDIWKARLLENIADVVVIYDKEYRHLYVNEATAREAQVPVEAMIGKSNREMGIPSDIKEVEARESQIQTVFDTGKPTEYMTFHTFPDGNKAYYFTRFIPEIAHEEVLYVYAITRNITAEVVYKEKIRKSNKKLKREKKEIDKINQTLENFVHIVAHDLKSPLNNIHQLINLYEKENSDERKTNYFNLLKASFNRFENTILSLMEVIVAQNKVGGSNRQLAFQKVYEIVMADLQKGLELCNGRIDTDFDLPVINFVESYLVSILKNLISNAVKYHHKSRPLVIHVSSKKEGKYVVLTVKDNGIGIDIARHEHKLFLPFKRFTQQADGKGLGLSIIKSMVEKNGGRVEVDSKIDEGTSFRVYLKEYS